MTIVGDQLGPIDMATRVGGQFGPKEYCCCSNQDGTIWRVRVQLVYGQYGVRINNWDGAPMWTRYGQNGIRKGSSEDKDGAKMGS